jgi:hypothetical protein
MMFIMVTKIMQVTCAKGNIIFPSFDLQVTCVIKAC